jgi:hypothetical protein
VFDNGDALQKHNVIRLFGLQIHLGCAFFEGKLMKAAGLLPIFSCIVAAFKSKNGTLFSKKAIGSFN